MDRCRAADPVSFHARNTLTDSHDRLIWTALALLVIIVFVTGGIVFGSIFFAPASNETVRAMIEGRIIQRSVVLFLIIPVITLLAVQDKISGEAALAALSAIAGYILGGVSNPAG